jgi:T-complex protein 1 subunit eta
MLRKVADDVS